jgi:peptidoglycan/LPS O-acetylase OafA/YrhL
VYLLQFIFILCLLPPLVSALNRWHIVQDFVLLPVLIITGFLTTGICAWVMYRFIEAPAIRVGHVLTKKIQIWVENRRQQTNKQARSAG